MILKSDRLTHVHSDIRGPLYVEALRMQAAGTPVLRLNTGNPGNFGFQMPQSVRQALLENVDKAVPYCDVRGMAGARQAILEYHKSCGIRDITPEDIYICNGVSEAVSMLMSALVGTGDEVLVPSPCYSLWSNNTYLGGGKPVYYRCDPQNAWNPDLEDMRAKITGRTKAILVINPNNPTGAIYSKETLLAIAQLARENHLLLLADEIYDRLTLENAPTYSMAALAPDLPCVTFNGLSKSHIICGFRCGWMVFSGPRAELAEVEQGVTALASMRLCGNTLTQLVIPAALQDRDSTRAMMLPGGRLYEQSKATVEGLRKIPGVTLVPNRAAFYLFPGLEAGAFDFESDEDFAMKFLHEKHILVIPGHGFDWFEDLRFRIVMLPEPERITAAMASLGEFLDEHRR
jgi:alanine-synthesizing transaminase